MAWDDTQESGSAITASEWNTMVTDIKGHWNITGMADLQTWNSSDWHNSSIIWDNDGQEWRPYKSGAGVDNISDLSIDADKDWNSKSIYNSESISSNNISGQLLTFTSAKDISSWNSSDFTNSGIMWNGTSWIAMPSGGSGGGVSNLSALGIDADKDWNNKGIRNITYLSSNTISGGTIRTSDPTEDHHVVTKGYADSNYGGGTAAEFWVYPDSEEISKDGNKIYLSGQGSVYVYSGINTLIISSQVGSTGNLSDLTIDADKDWDGKDITNLKHLMVSGIYINGHSGLRLFSSPNKFDGLKGKIANGDRGVDIYGSGANLGYFIKLSSPEYGQTTKFYTPYINSDLGNIYELSSNSTYSSSFKGISVSSQGIYCDWISGNSTNLSGTFNAESYMTSANIISNYIKSTQALINFYPSALGAGVSSQHKIVYDWFIESGEKLSIISGSLSNRINSIDGVSGDTISGNFFLKNSGNILWTWYNNSSQKLSENISLIGESGQEYTQTYDWFSASASKISSYQASGDEWSSAYEWYNESAQKLSTISGSLSSRIDNITSIDGATISSNFFLIGSGNTLWEWYLNSSQVISEFVGSGDKYSANYDWYSTYNSQLNNLLSSGEKYTNAYISASTGVFALATHTHDEYGAWSGATGYIIVSSNAKYAYDEVVASGTEYTNNYNWYTISASKLSEPVISSQYYSKAWASTQSLQDLAFMNESDIDEVGTIGTGVWQGTTIDYNYLDGIDTISSNAKSSYDWFVESAQKLTTISGSLSDRINAVGGITGDTISSNFFYIDSGNTLWTWYNNSSQKLSNFVASGDEYSKAYASSQIAHYDGVNGVFGSVSSQGPISGSWVTPLYHTRPSADISLAGQIIRTSGATNEKTYVYMCVKNDANSYEWMQLGVST